MVETLPSYALYCNYNNNAKEQLLAQICASFSNDQIEIPVTSKSVAIATSKGVKDTLLLTFSGL